MDGMVNCLIMRWLYKIKRDPSYKLNLGWVSFLLMSCYVRVVFIAASHFAVGATPSRDFSDILSRCELHRKEHKKAPYLAAGSRENVDSVLLYS